MNNNLISYFIQFSNLPLKEIPPQRTARKPTHSLKIKAFRVPISPEKWEKLALPKTWSRIAENIDSARL